MTTALAVVLASSLALLAYSQAGYPLLLRSLAALRRARTGAAGDVGADDKPPRVTLVIAAYAEAAVIEAKVANALALDYPRDRLEVIVSCDGSTDGTPELARAAGADVVIENPRGGKVRAQDAAVRRAGGEIVAFSDANAVWEPGALTALVARFADERVGYVCGRVEFVNDDGGTNQEGLYWRYEMALRSLESRLCSVTAGNGAIYAVRREAYVEMDPVMGHDLSLPFTLVKRGWKAVEEPVARAREPMVPSVEGEFARKRRMMGHVWPIVIRGGMLSPRGYPPLYALMIFSHRVLRYSAPFLHVLAAAATAALLLLEPGSAVLWALAGAQVALLASAALAGRVRARPLLLARYYVLTTASPALGLWDWLRHGTPAGWEAAEGTR